MGGDGKVISQPDFMGLSRLTTNDNFGDITNLGDRTLAIWVGRGYYYFTTYDINSRNSDVHVNIDFVKELDN